MCVQLHCEGPSHYGTLVTRSERTRADVVPVCLVGSSSDLWLPARFWSNPRYFHLPLSTVCPPDPKWQHVPWDPQVSLCSVLSSPTPQSPCTPHSLQRLAPGPLQAREREAPVCGRPAALSPTQRTVTESLAPASERHSHSRDPCGTLNLALS